MHYKAKTPIMMNTVIMLVKSRIVVGLIMLVITIILGLVIFERRDMV